ncbi:Gram-positive cocci surface proteins LPxTG domain-containing protein [Madurella fahalii]|uniref:Gram-positive cocci surface proteins LPxTG domain-containing protein n=1 Tax=Madurella fahalii TaxID=1157608 RepID=A0ABQ0GPY1_9PEZI
MLIPRTAGFNISRLSVRRTTCPATRCLSITTARPATPTAGKPYGPTDSRGGNPVDDIDVVFDYPSEGQTAHQKQPLESSGLDIHSAMPHHSKSGMKAGVQQPMGRRLGKEMGYPNNNMIYMGLGALGLGGLYMATRRRGEASSIVQPGDLAAQKSSASTMEKMVGRGR